MAGTMHPWLSHLVRIVAATALASTAVVACGDDEDADARVLASGLEVPWGLSFLPDGDALVGERDSGRILRVPADGGDPEHVATVPGVVAEGEGGLLGIAVSPLFIHDSFVYAYLTSAEDNRIVRFRLVPDDTEVVDLETLVDGIAKASNHNGGGLAFGPDGMLYAGTGDAARPELSQDPNSLNGKILRMTPVGGSPPDNPVAGSVVYSMGHRNVQGLAWDSAGRLWAPEFGQDSFDEVNLIEPGNNYGWPEVEGEGDTADGRFTNPQVTWSTSEASPSGAAIVQDPTGDTLFVAGLRGERLWRVPLSTDGRAGSPSDLLDGDYGRLRNVAVSPEGSLWVTTSNRDGRGDPADDDDRVLELDVP
jgi:glucose/arabinose dehydrogenase